MEQALPQEIGIYHRLGLTPIPLKPHSKEPLVKWRDGWNPTIDVLERWTAKLGVNWGVRCGAELVVLDFDIPGDYQEFITNHSVPADAPTVKTSRGYHIWLKPKHPVATQKLAGVELKASSRYVVAPPSEPEWERVGGLSIPIDEAKEVVKELA